MTKSLHTLHYIRFCTSWWSVNTITRFTVSSNLFSLWTHPSYYSLSSVVLFVFFYNANRDILCAKIIIIRNIILVKIYDVKLFHYKLSFYFISGKPLNVVYQLNYNNWIKMKIGLNVYPLSGSHTIRDLPDPLWGLKFIYVDIGRADSLN